MINKKYSGKISEKCENLEYIKMKNLICKEQYCISFIFTVNPILLGLSDTPEFIKGGG